MKHAILLHSSLAPLLMDRILSAGPGRFHLYVEDGGTSRVLVNATQWMEHLEQRSATTDYVLRAQAGLATETDPNGIDVMDFKFQARGRDKWLLTACSRKVGPHAQSAGWGTPAAQAHGWRVERAMRTYGLVNSAAAPASRHRGRTGFS